MTFEISEDRKTLTLFVDDKDRHALRALPEEGDGNIHLDSTMCDFLEQLTCNSELQWTCSEITGDLSNAPMLAYLAMRRSLMMVKTWFVAATCTPVVVRVRCMLSRVLNDGCGQTTWCKVYWWSC
jgi:hypothetical protein